MDGHSNCYSQKTLKNWDSIGCNKVFYVASRIFARLRSDHSKIHEL